jgi:hypothetical protein
MLKCIVVIPEAVKKLLLTTRELRFGELYGVDLEMRGPRNNFEVSKAEKDLVKLILDDEACYIDVLTVHQSEPVTAEMDMEVRGFRCRKKIKFPTPQAAGI